MVCLCCGLRLVLIEFACICVAHLSTLESLIVLELQTNTFELKPNINVFGSGKKWLDIIAEMYIKWMDYGV